MANCSSVDVFFAWYHFSSMGVDTILGNESGIQWQNYGAILQESEMTAGFHSRNWISNLFR